MSRREARPAPTGAGAGRRPGRPGRAGRARRRLRGRGRAALAAAFLGCVLATATAALAWGRPGLPELDASSAAAPPPSRPGRPEPAHILPMALPSAGSSPVRPLAAVGAGVEDAARPVARPAPDVGSEAVIARARGTVRGLVRDLRGEPVAQAVVLAVESAPVLIAEGSGCVISFALAPLESDVAPVAMEARERVTTVATRTAADGTFEIAGELSPNLTVVAWADGFDPASQADVAPDDPRAVELRLSPSALLRVTAVDATTHEPVPIEGVKALRFVDADGKRTTGAAVQARELPRERADAPAAWEVTGAGRFGTSLTVRAAGYVTGRQVARGLGSGERADVVVELERGASIEGRIVDASGRAVPGATVQLLDVETGACTMVSTTADDAGRYRIEGLTDRAARLLVCAEGWAPRASEALGLAAALPVVRDVVLAPAASLSVTLRYADGRPMPGRMVGIEAFELAAADPSDAQPPRRLQWLVRKARRTDDAGRAELDGLPPGRYVLKSERDRTAVVDVREGEQVPIEMLHDAPARLVGTVTRGGAPVEGAIVSVEVDGEGPASSDDVDSEPTGPDGRYAVDVVAEGEAEVRVYVPGPGEAEDGVDAIASEPHWVELALGATAELDVALSASVLDVHVVSREDGRPLAGVEVGWHRIGPWDEDTARILSDAEGHAVFPGLPDGTYTAWAGRLGPDGWATSTSAAFEVVDGVPVAPLRLELERGPVLAFEVATVRGAPAPQGSGVVLRCAHPPEEERDCWQYVELQDGMATASGMHPGRWSVVAHRGSRSAGREACLDLVLDARDRRVVRMTLPD